MFVAALMSRSCRVPQDGHVQRRFSEHAAENPTL
jgi:hypothetical protein